MGGICANTPEGQFTVTQLNSLCPQKGPTVRAREPYLSHEESRIFGLSPRPAPSPHQVLLLFPVYDAPQMPSLSCCYNPIITHAGFPFQPLLPLQHAPAACHGRFAST